MNKDSIALCIKHCTRCHDECLTTAMNFCPEQGGKHAEPAHLRLMLACAEICQATANVMRIGSDMHPYVCRACAEICTRCADDCDRINDMEACARVCRACAESCRAMAA